MSESQFFCRCPKCYAKFTREELNARFDVGRDWLDEYHVYDFGQLDTGQPMMVIDGDYILYAVEATPNKNFSVEDLHIDLSNIAMPCIDPGDNVDDFVMAYCPHCNNIPIAIDTPDNHRFNLIRHLYINRP